VDLVHSILAALIAVGIPLLFLLLIYLLDLYASSTFWLVVLCFGWGAIGGAGLAYLINVQITIPLILYHGLDYVLLYVLFAPVVEEVFKSAVLIYASRRPQFTYFVDGAIYGFAAGIGFSITENFLHMGYYPESRLALAFVRAFSVCLMHGTSTALVGVAVARARFRGRDVERLALVGGWAAAILLHISFNCVSQAASLNDAAVVPLQVALGMAGVILTVLVILVGLREERGWIAETLELRGVSMAEVRGAQASGDLGEVLEPITRQFPREAEQLETFLRRQAQLGIKRKIWDKADDPKLRRKMGEEVALLEEDVEQLRRGMSICTSTYLQCVFPEDEEGIWPCLEEMVSCDSASQA
jgi:RsiW-degrading membrane proteinase PrsW (M82 family)